jgi:hypothetical protein
MNYFKKDTDLEIPVSPFSLLLTFAKQSSGKLSAQSLSQLITVLNMKEVLLPYSIH